MSKTVRKYLRGTASQVAAGCLLAIAIVAVLEASVVYDEDCGRGRGWDTHVSTDWFGRRTVSIRHGRCRLEAILRGDVEFSPDERRVRRLSPDAYFEIRERVPGARKRLEVRPGAGGEPAYSFFVDRRAAGLDERARDWLQAALERLFRVSGLDAEGRVGRLLAAGGLPSVLAEIPEIPGDHVQALYLEQARIQAGMEAAEVAEWLRVAGRHVGSDFELGRLLSGLSASDLEAGEARAAYVEAARTIGSDFELRRCLEALINGGGLVPETLAPETLAPETLATVLEAAAAIGSDFELATLLVGAVRSADRDPPAAFFDVLAGVGSDFEHRRVLDAVVDRRELTPATVRRILASSASIGSDAEQARLLARLAETRPIADELRPDFERALAHVGSDFERGRVRRALAAGSGADTF